MNNNTINKNNILCIGCKEPLNENRFDEELLVLECNNWFCDMKSSVYVKDQRVKT